MTLPAPKAVLFDWDNTLVDSWTVIRHSLNVTLEAFGHAAWSLQETRERVRESARDAFPKLFGDRAEEAKAIFYRTYQADHLEKLRPCDGAEAAIGMLGETDLFLGVISNKHGPILRREAGHLGWDRHFRTLVGATDAALDKPAVEAVELALRGSGLSPGRDVWLVGDTDIDMTCAARAGCVPVLVRPEAPGDGEFAEAAPRFHVRDCAGLVELLKSHYMT